MLVFSWKQILIINAPQIHVTMSKHNIYDHLYSLTRNEITAYTFRKMFKKFQNKINRFCNANLQCSHEEFLSNTNFFLRYQRGRIHLYFNFWLLGWKSANESFLGKQAKSLVSTRKSVLFLSETRTNKSC